MAFSSVQFLFVFLPLSLAVYWLCPKWLRNAVLAAFSLLFFAWAGLKGAAILVLLAGINWLGGLSLGRLAHKRPLLILLILLDLAVLGGFKYAGFAAETVNALVPGLLPVLSPALPLGLSFYVFTAIGYCADVAAGKVESEKNPIRFAVFLAFFGHGPSGPIVRYGQQAPQLDPGSETRRVSADRFCYGIKRLVLGLAKKAIIADQLALIYAKVASVPAATLPAPILVLGYTAYMMQLYFDFSGYSDMAIGIGEFFGITLPENFEYPYLACSVGEYWRRWHISLSSWFRDYLYFPLGGSRGSSGRTAVNLMITFLVSGLWHGAGWHYVVWGAIHGSYQVAGRGIRYVSEAAQKKLPEKKIRFFSEKTQGLTRATRICVTFILTDFAWLFFRADHLGRAVAMLRRIVQNGNWLGQFTDGTLFGMGLCRLEVYQLAFAIGVLLVVDILHESGISIRAWLAKQVLVIRWSIYMLVLLGFVVLLLQNYGRAAAEFLYFQF